MSAKHHRLRLRDYFAGRRDPPPRDSSDNADLINDVVSADEINVEDVARQCGRTHARMWELAEQMHDEEKRGGRKK
jgi:hypothetical protein